MNNYNYSGIPLSVEVREFLAENDKEWKRQKDRIYQCGVSNHAFDVEERSPGNPGGATCDPIYAVTRAQKLSAEKAFFRQEARKALNAALLELSASGRRRLFLHFYDELSYSEIARRENVSESAVRGQIKASLLQLRRVLVAQEITLADFDCPSDHGLLPVLTRNGQKAKDRKRVLTRGSGDRHVA